MRSPSLSRSVVTVIAAFAAGPSCGGGDDDPEIAVNPPCALFQTGCMPPVEACPQDPPTSGAACGEDGLKCPVDTCAGLVDAVCADGAWDVPHIACNPPPPADPCPADSPTSGASCFVSPDESCSYGDCYGSSTIEATCRGGAWEVTELTCNPPPIECPVEPPAHGVVCEGVFDMTCGYGDCDGHPSILAACTPSGWKVSELTCGETPPLDTPCPNEVPEQEGACAHRGNVCGYGDCMDGSLVVANCANGTWDLSPVTCTPLLED